MIPSQSVVNNPLIAPYITISSIYDSFIGQPLLRYDQTASVSSINTIRGEERIAGIVVGQSVFITIPDEVSIGANYSSNFVGIGLRIFEVLQMAGQYIGAYTTAQRPTKRPNAAGFADQGTVIEDGDMIYDRTLKLIFLYNGTNTTWEELPDPTFLEKTLSLPSNIMALNGTARWYPSKPITINSIDAYVGVAATGQNIIVNIKKNGTTILLSNITINANAFTSGTITPIPTTLLKTDYITIDVIQVGSVQSGADLAITFKYK